VLNVFCNEILLKFTPSLLKLKFGILNTKSASLQGTSAPKVLLLKLVEPLIVS